MSEINPNPDEPVVKIRAFRAVNDPESAQKFIDGHARVLEMHGVTKVTSANHAWAENPHVFVINVESMDGDRVFGGARIHVAGGTQALPIEEATGYMDPKVNEMVRHLSLEGTGELCGLWNSLEVAGLGIGSFFSTRAGVTITNQLGIKSLWALCAPYTVKWAERVGCRIVTEVGNEGTFYYPKMDLLATAVLLPDINTLEMARPIEQRRMFNLRQNMVQEAMEVPPGKRFEVKIAYDIDLGPVDTAPFINPFQISTTNPVEK
jgi:hypothetical protein